jgi:hypothetical protein
MGASSMSRQDGIVWIRVLRNELDDGGVSYRVGFFETFNEAQESSSLSGQPIEVDPLRWISRMESEERKTFLELMDRDGVAFIASHLDDLDEGC